VDWELIVTMFVTLIISLTFHEAAHAWFALLGGDRTALHSGQVTLNPLPHMQREPFGMVLLPLVSLYTSNGLSAFGFAHAPFDPFWAARHPRKAALMSFAGPLANFVLAAIAFGVLWYIGKPDGNAEIAVRKIAKAFLYLNLLLGTFNLVPIPPLDGTGIVRGLAPATGRLFDAIESVPYLPLVLIFAMSHFLYEHFLTLYYAVLRLVPASLG
jgi:Zn-dependent protease